LRVITKKRRQRMFDLRKDDELDYALPPPSGDCGFEVRVYLRVLVYLVIYDSG